MGSEVGVSLKVRRRDNARPRRPGIYVVVVRIVQMWGWRIMGGRGW